MRSISAVPRDLDLQRRDFGRGELAAHQVRTHVHAAVDPVRGRIASPLGNRLEQGLIGERLGPHAGVRIVRGQMVAAGDEAVTIAFGQGVPDVAGGLHGAAEFLPVALGAGIGSARRARPSSGSPGRSR